jgi:aminoglycoside phosphotransferase (APT) family kinase protein
VRLHVGEVVVDTALAARLVSSQFPQWADVGLEAIGSKGTDSVVFRLGETMGVRFPRIGWAVDQVNKELEWLPVLGSQLSIPVPQPVTCGKPALGYPWPWLVYDWIDGQDALHARVDDEAGLAGDLANFLRQLQRIPHHPAPAAGARAGRLAPHDHGVRVALDSLGNDMDTRRALDLWEQALAASPWSGPAVWVHGDLLPGNLLISRGRLAGVIDWAATGVGDPACDLMWLWGFGEDARAAFRTKVPIDDATWARAKGWVLQQSVMFIPYYRATLPAAVAAAGNRLAAVLAE